MDSPLGQVQTIEKFAVVEDGGVTYFYRRDDDDYDAHLHVHEYAHDVGGAVYVVKIRCEVIEAKLEE